MLSVQLCRDLDDLLTELDGARPLLDGLLEIWVKSKDIWPMLESISKGGQQLNQAASSLHTYLVSAHGVLKPIPSRAFYKAIERVVEAIDLYVSRDRDKREHLTELRNNLEGFVVLFEKFLSSHAAIDALPVLQNAPLLLIGLRTLRETVASTRRQLSYEIQREPDEDTLVIQLGSHNNTLEAVIEELTALLSIFRTIQSLSPDGLLPPRPVRIAKLESGSLFVELV